MCAKSYQNGNVTDEVLMLDTLEDKLKPIEFIGQDDNALKSALEKCESLIPKHIPCVEHEHGLPTHGGCLIRCMTSPQCI